MSRKSTYNKLIKSYGFFPAEARELAHTSKEGFGSMYMQRLLGSQRAIFLNAKRYGWSERKYREYIKELYIRNGWVKQDRLGHIRIDIWKRIRDLSESTPIENEYESPWAKRAGKKAGKKREGTRATRKALIEDWIRQLTDKISRTSDVRKLDPMLKQRANLENLLKRYKD